MGFAVPKRCRVSGGHESWIQAPSARTVGRWLVMPIVAVALTQLPAAAQNRTWFGPDGGLWTDAPNWLPSNVPDTTGENAIFSSGTGGVVFTGGHTIGALRETGGAHTFYAVGPTSAPTLFVNVDAVIARSGIGTSLTLAETNAGTAPVNLHVFGELGVFGDGALHLAEGARANADSFGLGHLSTGDGELTADGVASQLAVSGPAIIGAQTSTGTVTLTNRGAAVFGFGLDAVTDAVPDSAAVIDIQSGGVMIVTGDANFGTGTGADQSATMTISGSQAGFPSRFIHTDVGPLTIGGAGFGLNALVDVNSGGSFQTSTGPVTVANSGELRVNTGTLDVNGDLTVNGTVDLQAGTTFDLAAGKDISITSGGDFFADTDVTLDGGQLLKGPGATTFELGSGRTLIADNGALVDLVFSYDLNGGATFDIRDGSTLAAAVHIGRNTDGVLIVSDPGTTLTQSSGSSVSWGTGGGTAAVTIRSDADANLASVFMAGNPTAGTTATLDVESAANVSLSTLHLAVQGGTTTSARINLTGEGRVTQTGTVPLIVGHASEGSAQISISDVGSTFTTGTGDITVNATGLIEAFDDGSFIANGDVLIDGGTLRTAVASGPDPGFFSLADGKNLTATNDAQLELPSATITNQQWNIQSGSDLSVRELTFVVGDRADGALTVDGLDGTDTSVVLDKFGLTVGLSNFSQQGQGTVTVRNGGRVDLNDAVGGSLTIANYPNNDTTGVVNIEAGGAVNVASTISVAIQGTAGSSGTINVRDGGTLTQTGSGLFRHGQAGGGTQARVNISNGGVVSTGTGAVTIQPGAELNINGGSQPGDTSGVFIANGPVTVHGQVNVPQFDGVPTDPGGRLVVNAGMTIDGGNAQMYKGAIEANAITLTNGGTFDFTGGALTVGTFTGDLTSAGGTLTPGTSGGQDTYGNTAVVGSYTQQAGSTLDLELAGPSPVSQHDLVSITGNAVLGGDLQLSLFGFIPGPADTFTVLGASSIVGVFANATTGQRLDTADGGGSFQINYGFGSAFAANELVLSHFIATLLGDYNDSGQVEQGDLDLVLQNWGVDTDVAGVPAGWVNDLPSGQIEQTELDGVLQNWGDIAVPNFGGFSVPEPGAAWAFFGLLGVVLRGRHGG